MESSDDVCQREVRRHHDTCSDVEFSVHVPFAEILGYRLVKLDVEVLLFKVLLLHPFRQFPCLPLCERMAEERVTRNFRIGLCKRIHEHLHPLLPLKRVHRGFRLYVCVRKDGSVGAVLIVDMLVLACQSKYGDLRLSDSRHHLETVCCFPEFYLHASGIGENQILGSEASAKDSEAAR